MMEIDVQMMVMLIQILQVVFVRVVLQVLGAVTKEKYHTIQAITIQIVTRVVEMVKLVTVTLHQVIHKTVNAQQQIVVQMKQLIVQLSATVMITM